MRRLAPLIALLAGCPQRAEQAAAPPRRAQPAVMYMHQGPQWNGETIAYVYSPRTHSCPSATTIPYRLVGLWRFVLDGTPVGDDLVAPGAWQPQPALNAATSMSCDERPIPFPRLMGVAALELGTYWVIAEVDGQLESAFVYIGAMWCQDLDSGPPPAGHVTTCVLGDKSGGAWFVPDPTDLAGEACRSVSTCRAR